jgi:uncharacterized protein (DUF2252 family)
MTAADESHLSVDERVARGKRARERAPRSGLSGWAPAPGRPDPVAVLEAQNALRESDLVPVRMGRMAASAFTFYRGGAKIMAADLQHMPRAGLEVQLCGDAHLSNFGVFASPERALVFDLNDFDETLPGPFEYDVLRLAVSFVVAARDNEFDDDTTAVATCIRSYRETMHEFAGMGTLEVWYAHLRAEDLLRALEQAKVKQRRRSIAGVKKVIRKASARDSLAALSKLAEYVDGEFRIVHRPPVVVPLRDLPEAAAWGVDEIDYVVHEEFEAYQNSVQHDLRHLLRSYRIVDVARKVVGIGSVGTHCLIALLEGRDAADPLFLQIKEAGPSVLEDHLDKSAYEHAGERVVRGQTLTQAVSDIFLGWTHGSDSVNDYYWRQLRDMKGSVEIESIAPPGLDLYARVCGGTLARAHARTGDPIALAAYLGKGDAFDRAVVDFAHRYADQNERDHAVMLDAVKSGRLQATPNV